MLYIIFEIRYGVITENERIAGANSVGDDRIFWNEMEENERIA
jgi:hypothetical protein